MGVNASSPDPAPQGSSSLLGARVRVSVKERYYEYLPQHINRRAALTDEKVRLVAKHWNFIADEVRKGYFCVSAAGCVTQRCVSNWLTIQDWPRPGPYHRETRETARARRSLLCMYVPKLFYPLWSAGRFCATLSQQIFQLRFCIVRTSTSGGCATKVKRGAHRVGRGQRESEHRLHTAVSHCWSGVIVVWKLTYNFFVLNGSLPHKRKTRQKKGALSCETAHTPLSVALKTEKSFQVLSVQ